jgi:hypothetical protein
VPRRRRAHRRPLSTAVDLGGGAATAEARSRGGAAGGSATNTGPGECSGRFRLDRRSAADGCPREAVAVEDEARAALRSRRGVLSGFATAFR